MAEPAQPEAGAAPGAAAAAPLAPAPAAAEAAAPAPVAAADVAPAAPAAELTTEKPSLLEEFDAAAKAAEKPPVQAVAAENKPPEKAADAKPEGDKPAEAKPADEKPADAKPAEAKPDEKAADAAKPAEAAKPVDAPKPEPIKFEFELPPALQANDEKIGAFNTLLNEAGLNAELGKKVGQDLLNLHAEGMQAYADHVAKEQHRVFNDTRDGWKKDVMADEQLGGSGYQTTMGAIARVRDLAVGEKDRPAFEQFLRITGAGDHPAFLRMMHNLSRVLDEPQAHEIPNDPKPIPAVQGRGARRTVMYDHPRSRPGGRQ